MQSPCCILLIFLNCQGLYPQGSSVLDPVNPLRAEETNEAMTAMIALRVSGKPDLYSVSLTHSVILHAAKEFSFRKPEVWNPNDLIGFVMDEFEVVLDTLVVSQPLSRRFEGPGENGLIHSVGVDLEENEILFRFPYHRNMKFLRVHQFTEDRKLKILQTFSISGD